MSVDRYRFGVPIHGDAAMPDLLNPQMSMREVSAVSSLGLAHIGDAVYEILVRTMFIMAGETTGSHLHQDTTKLVNASAQAEAADLVLPLLTEEEASLYRRGRNADVHNIPKNATHAQYSRATGLECLFGALYLLGRRERIIELFQIIAEEQHAT